MTGPLTKARTFAKSCFLCTLLGGLPAAQADVIELLNDDVLTGTIQSLDKDGATISSDVSAAPLAVRASAIKRMTFPGEVQNTNSHSERIILANGDSLPCQVLSMDQNNLEISTWYAGKFTIPRKDIRSVRFGLSEERDIYTGNDAPSRWGTTEGLWSLSDGTYTSKGSGILARELKLPENVRFRFSLAWKDTPNFVFRFCAESDSANTKQDTYEFLFNSAGMQIRRYEGNQQYAPLANIELKPHEVSDRKINVDLRVNRSQGNVTLYLDGKKIDTWPDTFSTPKGNYIIFSNRASRGTGCILSDIRVTDWNDGTPARHQAELARSKSDILMDSEGQKISGQITAITADKADERTIQFDVKHSTKPLMVPDRRVSILYFAQPEEETKFPTATFTAHLSGFGTLQLDHPQLKDGKVSTRHAILGPCTLDPKAIASIAQSETATEKTEKSEK
ncbi:hypothetical protein [Oceaniferula spumae]